MLAYAIMPHYSLSAQVPITENSHFKGYKNNQNDSFHFFLEQFPVLQTIDTIYQEIDVFPRQGEHRVELNNLIYYRFVQYIPFFSVYPIFRINYSWGVLVCMYRTYSNEYSNFDYLEIITYDTTGIPKSQIAIPYLMLLENNLINSEPSFHTILGNLFTIDSMLVLDYTIIDSAGKELPYCRTRIAIGEDGLHPIYQYSEDWELYGKGN